MKNLWVSFWAESLKVRKSKVFWLSLAFFVFVAFMMGLMMFVQKHPDLANKLGMIGTKASMMKMGEPDWANYLVLLIEVFAGIGLIGYGFITSWVFGREYTDHTLKDLLALPVPRSSIVYSKLLVVAIWSILLSCVFLASGIIIGHLAGVTGWSAAVFSHFLYTFTMVCLLSILLCTPVAFFASYSGGILLPVGIIILTLIMANFSGLLGLGPYFPWAIPGLFGTASGQEGMQLNVVSYLILFITSLAGLAGTLAWWRFADQK